MERGSPAASPFGALALRSPAPPSRHPGGAPPLRTGASGTLAERSGSRRGRPPMPRASLGPNGAPGSAGACSPATSISEYWRCESIWWADGCLGYGRASREPHGATGALPRARPRLPLRVLRCLGRCMSTATCARRGITSMTSLTSTRLSRTQRASALAREAARVRRTSRRAALGRPESTYACSSATSAVHLLASPRAASALARPSARNVSSLRARVRV